MIWGLNIFMVQRMNSTAPLPHSSATRLASCFAGSLLLGAGVYTPTVAGSTASLPLPLPVDAELRYASGDGPRLAVYLSVPDVWSGARDLTPLVLVHSVNAAASAAEIRPLFERFRGTRPVLAVELPGFGMSERGALEYTPQAMADAIVRAVHHLHKKGFQRPVDLMAVSLSSEFAALAALARPDLFRTLALVSPTGLKARQSEPFEAGRTKENRWLRALLDMPLWSQALFRLLTSRASMRYFLQRAWGTPAIDERLLEYNLLSTRLPGARHAPLAFISGALFTRGVVALYQRLSQPVWVAHGVRGDFTAYDGLARMPASDLRTVDVFGTGALPYFETLSLFASRYEAFLRAAVHKVSR